MRTLRDASFQVEGPRLFGALPRALRNLEATYPTFKAHLDVFLANVPDQPATSGGPDPGALDRMTIPSNSIKHWARMLGPEAWEALPLPSLGLRLHGVGVNRRTSRRR